MKRRVKGKYLANLTLLTMGNTVNLIRNLLSIILNRLLVPISSKVNTQRSRTIC